MMSALQIVMDTMFPRRKKKILLPFEWSDKVLFFEIVNAISLDNSKRFSLKTSDLNAALQNIGLQIEEISKYDADLRKYDKIYEVFTTYQFCFPKEDDDYISLCVVLNQPKHIDEFGKCSIQQVQEFCKTMLNHEKYNPIDFCELPDSHFLVKWIVMNAIMGFAKHISWRNRRDDYQSKKIQDHTRKMAKRRKIDTKVDHKGQKIVIIAKEVV